MMSTSKNLKATALATGLILALTAGALSTAANASSLSSEISAAQATKISLKQAITIASAQAAGTLVSAEFDDDDDDAQAGVYEIEFKSDSIKYEIKVDATTSKIIKIETKNLDSGDIEDYQTQRKAKVHIIDAMNIAEKNTKGRVMEIEFKKDSDHKDRTFYYEVEILKGKQIIELNVDANTGSVFAKKTKK
ncbi:PepSY domain-containing protein [Psychrobacter sp. TAE2020]|uniref:PepSY domain-containing protein n=1 Tax=Psychrobacter sp. TAE2020 TaxID=2846762 RepID=UPI001C0FF426|nr:PepSY domain-containing protein [Psychrobacter sp. TAE2020]MBU5617768.1 PepSY domain-containing protein [Psychrobacter sp. TAE2020]